MVAQIVNKLSNIYCQKAENIEKKILKSLYGIDCYVADTSLIEDLDLKKEILEYYNNYSEIEFKNILKTNNCLKNVMYG